MIQENQTLLPLLRECIALVKAVCSNTALLGYLDTSFSSRGATGLKTLSHLTKADHAEMERIYAQERFLQFRKLHPKLTDEALERRITWVGEQVIPQPKAGPPAPIISRLVPLFSWLGEVFLCEGRDGSLRVRSTFLAEWQDLTLVVPPLLVLATWLAKHYPPISVTDYAPVQDKICRRIQRVQQWLCDSTLPIDNDPFLDQLCAREGLDETHMHLNGTTEADKIWIDALQRSETALEDFYKTSPSEKGMTAQIGDHLDRLLAQEDPALVQNRTRLRKRLEDAIALKAFLLEKAKQHLTKQPDHTPDPNDPDNPQSDPQSWYGQTARAHMNRDDLHPATAEALRLIDIIHFVKDSQSKTSRYAMAFLHYVLLRSQFCRLLVQQKNQIGFDQFQYITLNELREPSENEYQERFRQIERDIQKPVAYLEGRFAPKTTPLKNSIILLKIMRGYFDFLNEEKEPGPSPQCDRDSLFSIIQHCRALEEGTSPGIPKTKRRLRLGLVPHFIKRASSEELQAFQKNTCHFACRDSKLRQTTDQSARALVATLEQPETFPNLIRGIDAASNERHAGPEVFAPSFRRMKWAGIRRFTYHAGEDFAHLAAGLRAINEAVLFLEMHEGCRIGHGTAAGLDPEKWWETNSGCVIQTREERLDDLIFAWGMLQEKATLLEKLPRIETEIRQLGHRIWGETCPPVDILFQAWRLRYLDPLVWSSIHEEALPYAKDTVTSSSFRSGAETYGNVDSTRQKEIELYLKAEESYPEAHEYFLRRHGYNFSTKAREHAFASISILQHSDVLDHEVLVTLQKLTLESLHKRHIAIETLPSSNVRISIHENYEEHHAPGWLGYGREFCPTDVVIGTDDPGIFATNLRLEYAHVLRSLEANGAERQARDELERLCRTAQRYRF